jgi:hypothetical protein
VLGANNWGDYFERAGQLNADRGTPRRGKWRPGLMGVLARRPRICVAFPLVASFRRSGKPSAGSIPTRSPAGPRHIEGHLPPPATCQLPRRRGVALARRRPDGRALRSFARRISVLECSQGAHHQALQNQRSGRDIVGIRSARDHAALGGNAVEGAFEQGRTQQSSSSPKPRPPLDRSGDAPRAAGECDRSRRPSGYPGPLLFGSDAFRQ